MIRVYFLHLELVDGVEQVSCIEWIHDALLECTEEPDVRKLIQDTTPVEHAHLSDFALEVRDATQDEFDRYNARIPLPTPDPDILRAEELLTSSSNVITQPEIWELVRIFGRRLGYIF